MRKIGWIIRKDLLRFFADRHGALLTVLAPVVLASLLTLFFAPGFEPQAIEVLVVDLDGSPEVQDWVAALDRDEAVEVTAVDEAEARARVREGRAPAALILPPGMDAALAPSAFFRPNPRAVTLLHDPSRRAEAQMIRGVLVQVWMETLTARLKQPGAFERMLEQLRAHHRGERPPEWGALLGALLATADGPPVAATPLPAVTLSAPDLALVRELDLASPIAIEHEAVSGEGARAFNIHAHSFAGMLCMFLLFMAQDMARHLLVERREGALTRLRLSLIRPWQILVGAAASTFLIAVLISVLVYAVGVLVFDISIAGRAWGLSAVIIGQALFAAGFSLLLAGFGRTERQLVNLGTFMILLMSFAGGAWLPSFLMPEWVRSVALALPTHWSTEGLAAMTWRGLEPGAALLPAGVLAAFGLACGAWGVRAFRWERLGP